MGSIGESRVSVLENIIRVQRKQIVRLESQDDVIAGLREELDKSKRQTDSAYSEQYDNALKLVCLENKYADLKTKHKLLKYDLEDMQQDCEVNNETIEHFKERNLDLHQQLQEEKNDNEELRIRCKTLEEINLKLAQHTIDVPGYAEVLSLRMQLKQAKELVAAKQRAIDLLGAELGI